MQFERFMHIAHRSFLVQVPKLVVCIQDVVLLGYTLPVSELVLGSCGVQYTYIKTFKLPTFLFRDNIYVFNTLSLFHLP